MSLDVYLSMPGTSTPPRAAIVVREVSSVAWTSNDPFGASTTCDVPESHDVYHGNDVYSANITHNLNTMADAAGLYGWLWRPDEHGVTTAGQLIQPLRDGLAQLVAKERSLFLLSPLNGWGTYEGLVAFTKNYLEACEQWPEATVRVSR